MSSVPIGDHALLSDCHSAALVTRDGSVDWLCFPRFDGASVFGRLLDDDAGHWRVGPTSPYEVTRKYLDGALVLETTYTTSSGTIVMTDALALGPDNTGHAIGRGAPHLLVRRVACTAGSVEIGIDYAPRPEYGMIHSILSLVDGGVTARGGAEWLVLTTPAAMLVDGSTAQGTMSLNEGDVCHFAVHRSTLEEEPARAWQQ